VQLFDDAQLKRGQDEITSNYIQYNSRTEVFQASSQKEPASGTEGPRVKAVLQPKAKNVQTELPPAPQATQPDAAKSQ
jgi:lipopolysaccharide transport protein LptA